MKQNKLTKNKLDQKHKYEVIQMLAAFQKPNEIVEHLKARYDISVSERNIYFYLENRVDDIETERERIRRDIRAIPIANLFYRLRERQALINDLKEHLWIEVYLNRDGRAIIDENGNPKRTEEYKFIIETGKNLELADRREILNILGKAERNGT